MFYTKGSDGLEQSRQKRGIDVKWSENIEGFFFKNPHNFLNPRLNWRLVVTYLKSSLSLIMLLRRQLNSEPTERNLEDSLYYIASKFS